MGMAIRPISPSAGVSGGIEMRAQERVGRLTHHFAESRRLKNDPILAQAYRTNKEFRDNDNSP